MSYLDNERAREQRRRWMRENAQLYVRPDAARFMRHDAHRFLTPDVKGWRHPDAKLFDPFFRYRKAGFDPAQPRVPAGNPDGGRWTDSGGAGDGGAGGGNVPRVISDATPDNDWKPGARYAKDRSRRYSVILEDEEARGGHVISKHVGKTDDDLLKVLHKNYYVGITTYNFQDAEGAFTDVRSANDFVNRTLKENQATVDLVASGQADKAMIEHRFGYPTGREAYRANVDSEPYIRSTYAVRVIILHDSRSEKGYSVFTAFPINKMRKERSP
ncbi:MAG: RNase A-like domain-containing protein [Xanthobacteraceae bacterium]